MLKLLLIFEFVYLISASSDIILKPIKQGGNTAAIIFIHGNELPPERYVPLLKQVQETSLNSLWIAVPAFPRNIPVEDLRPKVIDEMLIQLDTSGMPKNTTLFLSGHSLGGYTSQVLAIKYKNQIFLDKCFSVHFLFGNMYLTNTTYPVPTLTLSGDTRWSELV